MTVVGVIPARFDSTRFPGKVLVPIHGYPMVHHVYSRAKSCRRLDDVVIAADSQQVFDTCTELGDRVVMTGTHHLSGTDRVAEAVEKIAAKLIVNIQGDEPLLEPGVIDGLVAFMESHPEFQMGTVGSTFLSAEDRDDRDTVKVLARKGQVIDFYRMLPAHLSEGELLRHVGLYAFRRDFLFEFAAQPATEREREQRLEQLRALDMGAAIGLVTYPYEGVAVDTPEDLERVTTVWHE